MIIEITEEEREFLERMCRRAIVLSEFLKDAPNTEKCFELLKKLVKNED